MRNSILAAAVSLFILAGHGPLAQAQEATAAANPDTAWTELQQSAELPKPPAEWNSQAPSQEQQQAFFGKVAEQAKIAAGKAKAFYTAYPDSTNAIAAKKLECKMLESVCRATGGQPDAFKAWREAQDELVKDPRLTEKERYDLRVSILFAKRSDPSGDPNTKEAEYEAGLRALIRDFPNSDEPYVMVVSLAANSADTNQARALLKEALGHCKDEKTIAVAKGVLLRLDSVGKPVDIQFTALDGRKVDLSQEKGKVVLIDFWATWCGPCVGEIPHVKEAYEKYHDKGFDIVGISFDSNKQSLERFIQKNAMPWPQYFDGQGWDNKFGIQFGIRGIPAMWLIDKQGNLRQPNAREDLAGKVAALLAE